MIKSYRLARINLPVLTIRKQKNIYRRRRVIVISGSLIWSKTLMELIFNPCDEFRCSLEGPVSQIHSPHIHAGAPGNFSDLLRSVQMLKRVGCGKQRETSAPFQSLHKLQPWFVSLRWKICLQQNCSLGSCAWSEGPALGQNTHDDVDPELTRTYSHVHSNKWNLTCDIGL